MTPATRDRWAGWLLERRFGGDAARADGMLRRPGAVRDRVLDGAAVGEGDVVLDVGAGDGLVAFGALERVGPTGRVVFSDVSTDLLGHARTIAADIEVDYEARVARDTVDWDEELSWESFLRSSGNACAPTFADVLDEALTPAERRCFEAHVRPRFQARAGTSRSAVAYLRARKSEA